MDTVPGTIHVGLYTYADLMISFGSSAQLYEVEGRQVHLNLPTHARH